LPIFVNGNGSLALDTIVPIPEILAGLFVQAFCLQPLDSDGAYVNMCQMLMIHNVRYRKIWL
jgi:hypothetical protein